MPSSASSAIAGATLGNSKISPAGSPRSIHKKPWLGGRLCGDLRLRLGRLADRHTINAFGPGLLRYQGQAELLAHHTRKEAADRVLLPVSRLHDGGARARTAPCLAPLRV